jgi:hypothetical protein
MNIFKTGAFKNNSAAIEMQAVLISVRNIFRNCVQFSGGLFYDPFSGTKLYSIDDRVTSE